MGSPASAARASPSSVASRRSSSGGGGAAAPVRRRPRAVSRMTSATGSDPADDVVAAVEALGDEGDVALARPQGHVDVLARREERAPVLVGRDPRVAQLEPAGP